MAKINHNRPYLKYVDNMMREIAEIDSWHKPENNFLNTAQDKGVSKKIVTTARCGDGRKRPIREIDRKVHLLACSIISHIEANRAAGVNANLANALINSMPVGIRKNALIDWFCAFGAVSYDEEAKKLRYDKAQATRQLAGEAMPFWEFKPELEYKPFDFRKELANLINKAVKRQQEIAEAKVKDALYEAPDKIDPERLKALQALLASLVPA